MPELPEVEAARRAVEEHCLNKKIVKAIIANDTKVIDGVSPSDFESSLVGKLILGAHRKGKNMWLQLDSPPFPTFQFGMAGAIHIKGVAVTKYKRSAVNDTDEWPSKYSKFFIELDDGLELSFTDKRRFAKVRLLNDPTAVPPISELGPDALFNPMTVEELTESLSKKKTAIKPLLLDQSYISGIGNWIADEVLYQAKIHPQQISSSLTKESCATLHRCIKEVIHFAVRVDAECNLFPTEWLFHYRWGKKPGGINGKILLICMIVLTKQLILQVIDKAVEVGADSTQFPENWIFHSREKKPDKAFVDGKKIDFITSGGRTTAYVPELQKLTGGQAAKAGDKSSRENAKRKQSGEHYDADESPSEEDGNSKRAKASKGPKSRGQSKNPPRKRKADKSENDGDDSNDDDNVDIETAATKLKTKEKPRDRNKKPPAKTKPKGADRNNSGDDSDYDAAGGDEEHFVAKSKKGQNSNSQGKKPAAKKKPQEISDEVADFDSDEDCEPDADEDQKKAGKATVPIKRGKSKMTSNKKGQNTQHSTNAGKKSK